MNVKDYASKFYGYSKSYLKNIITINVLSQITSVVFVGYFLIIKNIIDGGILSKDMAVIKRDLFILILLVALREILTYIVQWVSTYTSEKINRDVQVDVYTHILGMPVSKLSSFSAGRLIAKVLSESTSVANILTRLTVQALTQPVKLIILFGVLFYYDSRLAWIVILFAIPVVAVNKFIAHKLNEYYDIFYERKILILSRVQEVLCSIGIVKAFVREKKEIEHFGDLSDSLIENDLKLARISLIASPVGEITKVIVLAVIGLTGGYQVKNGAISTGTFILFIGATMSIFGTLQALTSLYTGIISSFIGVKRVFTLLEEEREDVVKDHLMLENGLKGDIAVSNISFSYNKGEPILKDVKVQITENELCGILGESGCGKTTLAKILMRFYAPDSGSIIVQKNDINRYDVRQYRSHISVVFQEPVLYDGTILDNICFGKPNASMDEVKSVCLTADIHGFIESLPEGYQSLVGDQGVRLSGGQKQRVTIARALLTDPDLLILDEATSFVAIESEKKILSAIKEIRKNKKTVVLTNRLSALECCEKLYRFSEGRLNEYCGQDDKKI